MQSSQRRHAIAAVREEAERAGLSVFKIDWARSGLSLGRVRRQYLQPLASQGTETRPRPNGADVHQLAVQSADRADREVPPVLPEVPCSGTFQVFGHPTDA